MSASDPNTAFPPDGLRQRVAAWTAACGLDLPGLFGGLRGLPGVLRDYRAFRRLNRSGPHPWPLRLSRPCPADRYRPSGTASGHYFHQDLYVAQCIFRARPVRHIDVGSRIDGFVAHVAAFRAIEVLDVRPQPARVANITFRQCDLMDPPADLRAGCDSLSCLHVLEHLGLGRYGDPLAVDGHQRGFDGLCALLQPGGVLYLAVPIGPERVEFNGQRVFALATVCGWPAAHPEMRLESFAYVDDRGDLHPDATLDGPAVAGNLGVTCGCGIFTLRKAAPAAPGRAGTDRGPAGGREPDAARR